MGTLAHFPPLYPDEDFRSVVWRYHVRSDNKSLRDTNQELFNLKTNHNLLLPRNLSFLLANLPDGHTTSVQRILDEHTLYSLCKIVLSAEQNCQLLEQSASCDGALHDDLFRRIKCVIAPTIRYCPLCMHEDFQNFGECYVHGIHQIQFVNICATHKVRLITRCSACHEHFASSTGDNLMATNVCPQGHTVSQQPPPLSSEELATEMQLLEDAQALIKASEHMNKTEMIRKFEAALWDKGYVNLFGTINKIKFYADFDTAVKQITPDFVAWTTSSSKREIFRKDWRVPSLLTCIALMRFFSTGSVTDFLTSKYECFVPLPFGSGPWVCLSPVCLDSGKEVIKRCNRRLSKRKRKFFGRFCCPTCGYTYVRSVAIGDVRREQYNHSIRAHGELWEKRLIELRTGGVAWADIAKIFHISPKRAEKSYRRILRFNQSVRPPHSKEEEINKQTALNEILQGAREIATSQTTLNDKYLRSKRDRLLQVMLQCPDVSRTDIRKKNSKNYEWLQKHDKEWLKGVLPQPLRSRTRLNWALVDQQMCLKIEEEALIMYGLNPNRRIKPYTIISRLSKIDMHRLYNTKRETLPKSWEMLRKYSESEVEYQWRRFPGETK